jgi:hypothetical protein
MRILTAGFGGIFAFLGIIFLVSAGYDFLSSTNGLNQLFGTSNWYLEAAFFRGGLGIILVLSAIGLIQYSRRPDENSD